MQDILFPILTGLSLVFAGILIGYYLWFRDRTEQLELCEQLTADNESLASRLSAKSNGVVELEDQVERVNARNEQLQQLCDDLMASREKSDAHSRELESELYDSRCKLDQAREQLTAECRLRAKSEESQHLAKQQYLDSVVGLEKEWKHKVAESQSIISRHDSEVQRLTSLYEQTAEKLHLSMANVAELKSELNAQRQMLDVAKNNAVGLEKEYVSLESSMRSQIELLNESRGQTAAAQSAQKLAETTLEKSRDEIANLELEIRNLQKLNSLVDSLESQNSSLEASLGNERERVLVLNNERDSLLSRCQETEQAIVSLNKRSDNQQQTIRDLRTNVQELEHHRKTDAQRIAALSSQLRATEDGSSEQLKTIEILRKDLVKFETERNSSLEMLESLRGEFAQTETARFELQEDNVLLLSRISNFETEQNERLQTIESLRREIEQLEENRMELQETVVKLKSEVETLNALRLDQAEKIESLLEQLEVAGTGRSELETLIEAMSKEIQVLTTSRDEKVETIACLQQEVNEINDDRIELKRTREELKLKSEELEAEQGELLRTVETMRGRLQDVGTIEGELRAECASLTQRIADLEKLRLDDQTSLKRISEENAALILKIAELESNRESENMAGQATVRLNNVIRQRDNAMEQVQSLKAEISDLKTRLQELVEIQEQAGFPRLHSTDEDPVIRYTKAYGGSARVDEIKGLVFTQAPETRDDLKRIYGVAEVLEKKLNDCGIYTFKQIMEWDDRAIEEFSELLIFKDRIYRDNWLLQAKRLHDEKYGRRAA